MGPMIYDLVALLRDSYIELPFVTVRRLVDHYTKQGFAAGLEWCDDPDAVLRAFCLQTVQRKLKDAGRFIYIDRVKGNPSFLDYYKPSIGYVRQALEMLEDDYLELAHLLAEFEPAWHDD
jgi:aminoglycoside/choline kinase family phosphotransferase